MLPLRLPDERLQAVPLLVVQVGNRLDILRLDLRDQTGQVGSGVLPLLTPHQPRQEWLSELLQSLQCSLKYPRINLAFRHQLLLTDLKTSFHRQVLQETPFPQKWLLLYDLSSRQDRGQSK